jgi:hypothetical protein
MFESVSYVDKHDRAVTQTIGKPSEKHAEGCGNQVIQAVLKRSTR